MSRKDLCVAVLIALGMAVLLSGIHMAMRAQTAAMTHHAS